MNDTDNEASPYQFGYRTPPLSPTKTVSTEDWSSPRTPRSPRKTRSCVFFRDIDSAIEDFLHTLPSSPRKFGFASRLDVLSIPELIPAVGDRTPPQSDDDSPMKQRMSLTIDQSPVYRSSALARIHARSLPATGEHSSHEGFQFPAEIGNSRALRDESSSPPTKRSSALARIHARSLPVTGEHSSHEGFQFPDEIGNSRALRDESPSPPTKRRRSNRRASDSLLDDLSRTPSPSSSTTDTIVTDYESPSLPNLTYTDTSTEESASPTKLRRFPLRYASSPLRPSQWAARGGLLASPRQSRTGTPDRFIACRRPPAVTRESFELSNPAERREKEQTALRGTRQGADAFSRRLRRSGRMNEELRGLREAHSVISGRANANRRNANFRRSSVPLSVRQVSAGAVWNVGGPSAVSNTVVGVSTGRGRMLGSGTNAPLYKSAFLNRADPEAELEAYERRLALALDVDQTDRIFQHSSSPASQSPPPSIEASQSKHVWRDGAWIKDGVSSRLFSETPDNLFHEC
jgi:hypothetical protein